MTEELTDDDLRMVVEHGSGKFIRCLAAVKLAKRQGRLEELREKVEDVRGGG